jgi:hypothetical protein
MRRRVTEPLAAVDDRPVTSFHVPMATKDVLAVILPEMSV